MIRVLVVDDEIKIREVVREYAVVSGYECDEAKDGKEAIEKVRNGNYDCVVLDIMMPVLDGFTACRKIREFSDVAIIMLSARQEDDDKIFCFNSGADDYVVKPFSPKELMARIRVMAERHNRGIGDDKLTFETLTVDTAGRNVYIDNQKIDMTPKEYELLVYLMKNRNIALGREQILSAVWKIDYYGDDRTVDTHIKMLRKSIGRYRDHVVTVRGMGYKFEA